MLDNKTGFAVGNNLFSYDGDEWRVMQQTKSLRDMSTFYVKSKNEIYLANRIFPLYYSKLYMFDGVNVKELFNPFGNEIVSIVSDKQNILWLGGDREFAKRTSRGWRFLPYPPVQMAIDQIFPIDSNKVWVRTVNTGLHYFNGSTWKSFFTDTIIKSCCMISEDSLLVLADSKIFLVTNEEAITLYSESRLKEINLIAARSTNSIFAIGSKGKFLHYNGYSWNNIQLPMDEDLNSISLTSSDEGFVACNSGIIFKFSKDSTEANVYSNFGFQSSKPMQYARNIDDEYSVGIADLDMDGCLDVYAVSIYNPNRFYLNQSTSDGHIETQFLERAVERKATGINNEDLLKKTIPKVQLGTCIADFDNDGDEDIYITSLVGENKFLLNNGNGYFRDVTSQSGRAQGENDRTNSAITGDVNNDGWLDIFLVNEFTSNRLFINKGNGYFYDVTESCGLKSTGGSNGATYGDVDNDGLLDLVVCNWGRPNDLYKNVLRGGKILFKKMELPTKNLNRQTAKSNGAVFFDFNNDAKLDLYITNRGYTNRLYKNNGNFYLEDITEEIIGTDSLLSYSATAADFDNDGFQDLFVSNVGKSVLYKNISGKKFTDVTLKYGAEISGYCTGTAAGDLDNDGDVDLYAACFVDGTSKLFINTVDNRKFIVVQLEGVESNRDAIGAKVYLYNQQTGKICGYREINGGSGYSSINSKQVHFGVQDNLLYKILVVFPTSGEKVVKENLKPGQIINISEEIGLARFYKNYSRTIVSISKDPETQLEALKFLLVAIMIIFSFLRGQKNYNWKKSLNIYIHFTLLFIYVSLTWLLLYRGIFLSTVLPISIVITGIILIHLVYERIILVRRIKEERQLTRDRIARDLHDDLASTISSGLIYADVLQRNIESGNTRQKDLAKNISNLLNEASDSITDIVWSVSPSHDTLKDLIARLRFFISNNCQNNNIKCNINISIREEIVSLSEEIRKNTFLIFKEALNNSFKHSQATVIDFNVQHSGNELELRLKDNGCGFHSKGNNLDNAHGNGLINMKKRASEIKAALHFNSSPDSGCEIVLLIKMS